jgi:uncharacterized protein YndB with AHSA1/START domain
MDAFVPIESDRHELILERVVRVPAALAFRVWTAPNHLVRWWGPRDEQGRDFTMPACEMDFRPGGFYRICIRSPQGEDHWHSGQYREITPPRRLVFTFTWERMGESFPQTLIEVDFIEEGAHTTRIRFRQSGLPSASERDGHESGWGECLDRLAQHLEGKP